MAINSTRAERLTREQRRLYVMRSGARLFAVYADEVEATSENLRPTPLPFAPAPVRGVVSQRGRVLTVIDPLLLDPLRLLQSDAPPAAAPSPVASSPATYSTTASLAVALSTDALSNSAPGDAPAPALPLAPPPAAKSHAPLVVALRGDEQLALSVERIEHDIELFDEDEAGAPSNLSPGPHLLRRTIQHGTDAIALLDTAHLFEAAMQGVERRRRRT